MRKIKFRAWEKINKEMRYYFHISSTGLYLENNEKFDFHYNSILQQYTGLKDKNGKEIYEGDIVIVKCLKEAPYNEKAQIIFYANSWCIDMSSWHPLAREGWSKIINDETCMEIIGNIYENPELLEEK